MQIWVHDTRMRKVTAINNAIPRMLSFYNSTWHRYLPQATNTFDFTIPKLYSGKLHEDLSFINDRAYFSFRNQGKDYVFYVANMVEDDFSIQLTCNDTNLELNNEQANAFSSDSAQTLAWYLEHMDLLAFTSLKIGINEISDRKRTLTFDSQETKLARLQSLMSQFDAEYEFVTELNNNGTFKQITLNIYQSPDSTHHGVGKVRSDVLLYYGNDVKGVQVTTDKTQLFNMAVFTGQDGLSMKDVERSDKNEDGKEEFYTRKGSEAVYAPLSAEMYPSTLRDGDNWTRKDFQTEYTDVNDLTAYAFRTMKQYAYPIITYTASVQSSFLGNYSDLALGDTVKIYDGNFVGGLALEARVTEQIISFDNPNNNSLVFSNYVKLKNTVSATLQKRLAELVEANTPYTIKLAKNNSLIFKNGQGETIITPSLYKADKLITADVTWRWSLDGNVTIGMTYTVKGAEVTEQSVLTVAAYIGNDEASVTEIDVVNVNDGANGADGAKGDKGDDGKDGKDGRGLERSEDFYQLTSIGTAPSYPMVGGRNLLRNSKGPFKPNANKIDNWQRFENTYVYLENGKQYVLSGETDGNFTSIYDSLKESDNVVLWLVNPNTSFNKIMSDDKTGTTGTVFTWNSASGTYQLRVNTYRTVSTKSAWNIQIEEGTTKTPYSQAPEDLGWSTDMKVPTADKRFLWKLHIDYFSDGTVAVTQPTIAGIMGIQGLQGLPGETGADGKTQYTHIAYADNATGGGFSQTDQTKAYIGMYQDFVEAGSNDPTKYLWSKWKGSDGAQGIPGKAGADGKTPYIHFAYADDNKGTNFSLTDKNQQYMGYYSDYTEADSTDYKKYKWVDRLANVKFGNKNLILKSNDLANPHKQSGANTTVTSTDDYFVIKSTGYTANAWGGMSWNMSISEVKAGEEFSILMPVYIDSSIDLDNGWNFNLKNHPSNSTAYNYSIPVTKKDEWFNVAITFKTTKDVVFDTYPFYVYLVKNGLVRIKPPMLVRGNVIPSDYVVASEDTQEQIDSKADDALTQEQLNALAEKNRTLEAELEAKAALATVEAWKEAYDSYVAQNNQDKTEAEQKLITLTNRVAEWVKDWEDKKVQWSFLDTNMDFGAEGLRLGKKGSPTSILISNDRIGFYSGGSEVASMSNGTLTIDNGIFAKSLQIGHFREEVYEGDNNINVIRWVD
ncbi:tail assembly protein [Streptococcus phage Javan237]|uniref:phage tail protein n=1 Tax=Streptococcus gallolyticus TaxID=315405 RepID=UPI00088A2224|nr:phage tail protein [Streptococcus gallolyticus]QBX16208.1 tail assembly protein [Streptococcus phage Javan237]QBX25082.1 tail assembly protein [Streptococcus phage Javan238]SDJ74168.1 hypothetical protein SAMN04487842_0750 [Streptococcus gallolyticus]SDL24523.1 hypothetical protein SAMN04487841_0752 [Streptococcus gallolyticus]